jgi:dethiobiotin synthetase
MTKLTQKQNELKECLVAGGRLYYDSYYTHTYKIIVDGVKKTVRTDSVWKVTRELKEEGYIRKTDYAKQCVGCDDCEYYEKEIVIPEEEEREITEEELFKVCAPMFNFELDAKQIVNKALDRKIIREKGSRFVIIDPAYFWFTNKKNKKEV